MEMGGLSFNQSTLTKEQKLFLSIQNTKTFKKRVFIRFDHLAYNNKIFNMFFVILMLIYPSICLRVTRFFKCDTVGPLYVLGADLYTNCYDGEYYMMMVPAVLGVVFFVFGIPAFFLYLLYTARVTGIHWKWEACTKSMHRKRMALAEAQIDAQLSREFWSKPISLEEEKKVCLSYFSKQNFRDHRVRNRLGFIYYRYNEHVWWYEIVELSRKLILNSLVALVTPGEDSQIVTGSAICLFYFTMLLTIRPYKTKSDLHLASTTHASLFITLLCGLMLNMRVPFLGKYLFPTKSEREFAELLFVEVFVIVQVGLVCLQFVIGVLYDATCSTETKFLMSLEENRDLVLKQAISTISQKFGSPTSNASNSSSSKNKNQGTKFWEQEVSKPSESDITATMDNYVNEVVTGGQSGEMLKINNNQEEKNQDAEQKSGGSGGSDGSGGSSGSGGSGGSSAKNKKQQSKLPNAKAVRKLFQDYDFDESGEIDLEELRDMISEMHTLAEGESMPPEEAEADANLVMKTLDVDNTGLLGEDEFVEWIMAGLRVPKGLRDASGRKDERGRRLQNFLSSVETLANEMDEEEEEEEEEVKQPVVIAAKPKPKKKMKRMKTEVML